MGAEPADSLYPSAISFKVTWNASVLAAQFRSDTLSNGFSLPAACSTAKSPLNIKKHDEPDTPLVSDLT